MLPQEMGCGSGVRRAGWRRLRDWQEEAGRRRRACGGACTEQPCSTTGWGRPTRSTGRRPRSIFGERRAAKTGREGRQEPDGSRQTGLAKRHLVSDRKGVPLGVALTAANVHDASKVLEKAPWTRSSRSQAPGGQAGTTAKEAPAEAARRQQGLRRDFPRSAGRPCAQAARHQQQGLHRPARRGLEREVGAAPVGWWSVRSPGSHATGGSRCAIREAGRRHPRGVSPPPRRLAHLPQLSLVTVLQCTLRRAGKTITTEEREELRKLRSNKIWTADNITYIHTWEGFLYLAFILDSTPGRWFAGQTTCVPSLCSTF